MDECAEAMAMALLRGMVFVKYVAFKEVIIEGDCEIVIHLIIDSCSNFSYFGSRLLAS